MVVETLTDVVKFETETCGHPMFIYPILEQDDIHPADNSCCLLFIKDVYTKKTYTVSLSHSDSNHCLSIIRTLERLDNEKWVLDKKTICQLFPNFRNVCDVNLLMFVIDNDVFNVDEYISPSYFLMKSRSIGKTNMVVPMMKHLETFEDMADDVLVYIKRHKRDNSYSKINDIIIPTLASMETNGIFVDRQLFSKYFDGKVPNKDGLVYSSYWVYNPTGRPSNTFNGINYAALNVTDGTRSCFVSRYGKDGKMVLMDYKAFFPRIICQLTNYNIPSNVDIYEYLAKLYFKKSAVTLAEIAKGKQITFRQLFGGVEKTYDHIKYLSSLKKYIDDIWNQFVRDGYIETPLFHRKITNKHIADPNPFKLFNYLLQGTEGETAIPQISEINKFLETKNTKSVLYTYDSILFDFKVDDGMETLQTIRDIMGIYGKYPVKVCIGESYNTMEEIII